LVEKELIRIYIRSFGCPTNFADEEHMASCLLQSGCKIVKRAKDADILIYNTCAVKTPTENRIFEILKRVPSGKKVVVTGCLPLINFRRLKTEVNFDCALGPAPGHKIVDAVRRVEQGEKVVMLDRDSQPSLDQPNISTNRVIKIIPINYGCLGACSYCCVLFARGHLRSYPTSEVVKKIKGCLASGVKEIWLTSQDTACYGKDIDTSLPDLLREICKIERTFFVRVGMMTPNYASELLDGLVGAYRNEKIFKFLHLPVQSGDDEVLMLMNRMYSADVFRKIVKTFRKKISNVTIATDIICGFPNESEEAFKRTMELMEEIQPDIVNTSKFFARPNTPAERMKSLQNQVVKERSRRIAELVKQITLEKNKAWLSWEGKVFINEKGKTPSSWVGRNFAYKPVAIKGNKNLLGKILNVQITRAFPTYLEAEIKS